MNIHQVCVSYVNEQDRFLVRINSRDGQEMRVWLTRRLTLGLLPLLGKKVSEQLAGHITIDLSGKPAPDQRERMLEQFKKEAEAYQGDYKTPYKNEAATLPLGPEPLLLTEISLSLLASNILQMQLQEKLVDRTRNLQLALDPQLGQGLLHLLTQGLKQAQWLEVPAVLPAGPELPDGDTTIGSTDPRPRYLN